MKKYLGPILAILLASNAEAAIRGACVGTGGASTTVSQSNFTAFSVAEAGDSIAAFGFSQCPSCQTGTQSVVNNARNILGGRLYTPLANVFAVGGSYCNNGQIPHYYDQAIASGASIILGDGCRNDLAGGVTANAILGYIMPVIAKASNSSSHLIYIPLLPEDGYTTLQRQYRIVVNRTISETFSGQRPDLVLKYGLNPNNLPIFLDDSFIENYANGGRLPGFGTADGTHLNSYGAQIFGQQFANDVTSQAPPRPTYFEWFEDWYDATNNPTGNLLTNGTVNDGLMNGTSGSLVTFNGLTPTGALATRWSALRSLIGATGSTATMAMSKEVTRADGLSGTGQVMQIDCTGTNQSGQNYEQYRIQYSGTPTVIAGKVAYAKATVQLLDTPTAYLGAMVYLTESGNTTNQYTEDGTPLQDATGAGPAQPQGDIYLRSPPFTVQNTTTSMITTVTVFMNCSGTGHVKLAIRDVGVRYQ